MAHFGTFSASRLHKMSLCSILLKAIKNILALPKKPTGKINKYICCSFYAPPRSKHNNKLAVFLATIINQLRMEHPGSKVIIGADINDMKINTLINLDPTLKQIVQGFTNKNGDKTLDVILTDCHELMQEPTILPPLQVDNGKAGVDSDHKGVQVLPRTNLASQRTQLRQKITVRPFPESQRANFSVHLQEERWTSIHSGLSSTEMVDTLEKKSKDMVDTFFPQKSVAVGPADLPYFREELRRLKRVRLRAYSRHGRQSHEYKQAKDIFDTKLQREAIKYREKIIQEVREGSRGSAYSAIRKLGNRPGECGKPEFWLPAYVEQQLSASQAAEKLADHFSEISQTVEPLDVDKLFPALRNAIVEGRNATSKPAVEQHTVYRKILKLKKPNSCVPGDIPRILVKDNPFEYAKPATTIFNQIIKTAEWPRQWVQEHITVIPKSKTNPPQNEDDLRNIAKTSWMSKLCEALIGDFLLPVIEPYIDPGQCGGFRGTSVTHYLVKLVDFIHRTLNHRTPHCAVLTSEDLSKAYNRGSHMLVVEDLHAMHTPKWLLAILCSYLTSRSMLLKYQNTVSSARELPGGFGQGVWLGGILFIIKFNGACLRPPIPRPISKNCSMQVKFVDDTSQAASINLKLSLMPDPVERPRPHNYHERAMMVLKPEEDIVTQELRRFSEFTTQNGFVINRKKCYTMVFSRSRKYDFPPEFSIQGQDILEEKKEATILGVILQSNLRWYSQVEQMIKKAAKAVWTLRRMKTLGVDKATLTQFWRSEGRVHLEYQAPLWHSSITVAQSRALARAQRVAMAAITGRWHPSHSQQLVELSLEPLDTRRSRLCRRFAERTATRSRHTDIFSLAMGDRVTRGATRGLYREPLCRTQSYYRSAVPYLTRLLNVRL